MLMQPVYNSCVFFTSKMSKVVDELLELAIRQSIPIDTVDYAELLDKMDQLSLIRDSFHLPSVKAISELVKINFNPDVHEVVYLCGNSLGLEPKKLNQEMQSILKNWADLSLYTYSSGPLPASFCDPLLNKRMAQLILGANDNEVAMANGCSVNMHLLLTKFYQPSGDRKYIMIEHGAFPSDYYVVESQIAWHGNTPSDCIIELHPRPGEWCLHQEDIIASIQKHAHQLALIWLPGVQYVTGQLFDIDAITKAGHDYANCPVGWDLAHSVGNVPLELHKWDVDIAVWCSYKYLNGGPGCLGGLFVHEKHHHVAGEYGPSTDSMSKGPKLTGWWGHRVETRFQMSSKMELAEGATAYCVSNNSQFLSVSLLTSLDVFSECGDMSSIRKKSLKLTGYLDYLLRHSKFTVLNYQVSIVTPEDSESRGSQLTLYFKSDLDQYYNRLKEYGFLCDIRGKHFLRVTPCALYNRFIEVYRFAETLFNLLNVDQIP